MQTPEVQINDCYSAGDRGLMEWSQELRARWLGPLLRGLSRLHIRADHITLFSLGLGLAFVPLWLFGHPLLAGLALLLHVLVDGLDGPLARHQGDASARGSFTDTGADHLVVMASTLAVLATGHAHAVLGGAYLAAYTLVLAFSMVRNAMGIPYAWLVRPRFFVFAALPLSALGPTWVLDAVLLVSSLLLAVKAGSGFLRIRERLGVLLKTHAGS